MVLIILVCLKFIDVCIKDGVVFVKVVVKWLEKDGVVLDVGVYCDVFVGLWIWCGLIVEILDVVVLMLWIEYVFEVELVVQVVDV